MTLINKIASLNTDLAELDYKFTNFADFTADDIYAQERAIAEDDLYEVDEDELSFDDDKREDVLYVERCEVEEIMSYMEREDNCIEYVLPFLFKHCRQAHGLEFYFDGSPLRFLYLLKDRLYSDKALTTVDHVTVYKNMQLVTIGFSGAKVHVHMDELTELNYKKLASHMVDYLLRKAPCNGKYEYDMYTFYEVFYNM